MQVSSGVDGPCIQGSVMNEVKAAIAKAEGGAL